MSGKCFEIGTIQAFLDGETSPDVSLRLTDHVAKCDACARLLAVAEEESSLVFSALERELNSLVPTQRLWTRINDSITVEKSRTPVWQKFLSYVSVSLASPSIAAAAGLILVFGMLAILWVPRNSGPDNEYAGNNGPGPKPEPTAEVVDLGSSDPIPAPATATPNNGSASNAYQVKVSNYSPDKLRKMVQTADLKRGPEAPAAQYASDAYLPGEESYIRTISDLKQNVDTQKDSVLTPSTRVSYERDMAVVNDSIKRMREVVRKNPRNQAARQVLYSSYQDKIDLLNSVAQREELIAAMQ